MLGLRKQVNSTVPICAEIFKSKGVYNPRRLFGVTTLDVVRASRFISQHKGTDPADENITVVGGHSGATIVPLLSQSGYSLSGKDLDDYIFRVQFGGDEVVKAKDGAGSATLSMAMAGARFAESLLKAAQGQKGVIEPTFVDSPLYKDQGIDFFSSKVELGANGVEKIHEVGKVTEHEQKLLDVCLKDLKGNIAKGILKVVLQISELMLIYCQVSNSSRRTHRARRLSESISLGPSVELIFLFYTLRILYMDNIAICIDTKSDLVSFTFHLALTYDYGRLAYGFDWLGH